MKRTKLMARVLSIVFVLSIAIGAMPALASDSWQPLLKDTLDLSFNNVTITDGGNFNMVNSFLRVASSAYNLVYDGGLPGNAMGGKQDGFIRAATVTAYGFLGVTPGASDRNNQWGDGKPFALEFSICPEFSETTSIRVELWTHGTAYSGSTSGGVSTTSYFTTSTINANDSNDLNSARIYLTPNRWHRVRIVANPGSNDVSISVNGVENTYTSTAAALQYFCTARIIPPNLGENTQYLGLDDIRVTEGIDTTAFSEPTPQITSEDFAVYQSGYIEKQSDVENSSIVEAFEGEGYSASLLTTEDNIIAVWESGNIIPKYYYIIESGTYQSLYNTNVTDDDKSFAVYNAVDAMAGTTASLIINNIIRFYKPASGNVNEVKYADASIGGKTDGFVVAEPIGDQTDSLAGWRLQNQSAVDQRNNQWAFGLPFVTEFSINPWGLADDEYFRVQVLTSSSVPFATSQDQCVHEIIRFVTSKDSATENVLSLGSNDEAAHIFLNEGEWNRVQIIMYPGSNDIDIIVNGEGKTYAANNTVGKYFAMFRIYPTFGSMGFAFDDYDVTEGINPNSVYSMPVPSIDETNTQIISEDIVVDDEEVIIYRKNTVSDSDIENIFDTSYDAVYVTDINKIAVWEDGNINPKYYRVFDEGDFEFVSLDKDGSVATATVRAFGDTPNAGIMLVAFYCENKSLINIDEVEPVSYNGKTFIVFDTENDTTPEVDSYKVFYWDSLSGLVPFTTWLDFVKN